MTFPGAYLPGQSLFQPQANTDQQSVMIDLSFIAFNKKWSYNVCILLPLDFFSLHNVVEHVTVYQVISEILVVPREKTPTGAAARGNP